MLATTHLLATTIILFIFSRVWGDIPLNIIILTYIFGTAIDIDHIIFHPKESFTAIAGFFHKDKSMCGKYYLHSYLQEPWFALLILVISTLIFWQTSNKFVFLPGIGLVLHVIMDVLMKFDNLLLYPFSSKPFEGFIPSNTTIEYIVSITLLLVLYLSYLIFK
ncbi:hypothetical protein COX24_01220 [bacterium (Candidatus Gribaldobacteria) CG23_combo_of_CG06-09_8_20_14_all_37_87_8]|uniref:Metal-dependent hydrolase n=1 Tax=bacterium (Candidatus Gribaldobacteria) CG23_combo_of_CG06-09_8_20_14_all_37_87_8 TaxID=2014278 RepID=A0A2G9ZFJ6_9BACT|nr:MAG: hypothetical protein COX24_01220 [bacterium (Candidatus Gribaldobacteria) CG23_combo_of_CG06-09_8_20_14_all_37_87_8]